jgi:hypothetical protein
MNVTLRLNQENYMTSFYYFLQQLFFAGFFAAAAFFTGFFTTFFFIFSSYLLITRILSGNLEANYFYSFYLARLPNFVFFTLIKNLVTLPNILIL